MIAKYLGNGRAISYAIAPKMHDCDALGERRDGPTKKPRQPWRGWECRHAQKRSQRGPDGLGRAPNQALQLRLQ